MTQAAAIRTIPSGDDLSVKGILSGFALARPEMARAGVPSTATMVEYGPKCVIFVEDTPADTLFEVQEGVVLLYKVLLDGRRQVTGFVFPGDVFGLSGHEFYTYSAQATGKVKLLAISRSRLNSLRTIQPNVDRKLFASVGEDLRRAQEHILLLGRKTAIERLSSFLLSVWERTGASERGSSLAQLSMSRADIADFLGLTVETISRTLADLKSRKAIRLLSTDQFEILDADILEDMAAGDELDLAA
jgi:CRP/FNR family transcriptional regulator